MLSVTNMYSSRSFSNVAKHAIPWALLSVRVVVTPVVALWPQGVSDRTAMWFYIAAFITDYFDGATARSFGTTTAALRKTDSTADTFFNLAIGWLILRHHPNVFHRSEIAIAVFTATTFAWYMLDAIRWHRLAGFHAYSAKFFSITLLIWVVLFLSGVRSAALFSGVLIFGAASNIEGMLISLILREARCDVPSVLHAISER